MERNVVARDWAERCFSCDLIDPPGQQWLDFVYAANEVGMVQEGRLEMTVGDCTFIAAPGDEAFIPRGAVHSVVNIHYAATRWLYGYD